MVEPTPPLPHRPATITELVTWLLPQLADVPSMPRSALTRVLELLGEAGFLAFDLPVDEDDAARILAAFEAAGFRITRKAARAYVPPETVPLSR